MTTTSASPVATTKHIYIVSDDDMGRILLQETFWIYSKNENDITVFHSIEELQKKIAGGAHPDILFIGIPLAPTGKDGKPMSGTSPFSFIQTYKKEHPETKIVVYSKHAEPELLEQARESCADTCIVAGQTTPSEIVAIVENL